MLTFPGDFKWQRTDCLKATHTPKAWSHRSVLILMNISTKPSVKDLLCCLLWKMRGCLITEPWLQGIWGKQAVNDRLMTGLQHFPFQWHSQTFPSHWNNSLEHRKRHLDLFPSHNDKSTKSLRIPTQQKSTKSIWWYYHGFLDTCRH